MICKGKWMAMEIGTMIALNLHVYKPECGFVPTTKHLYSTLILHSGTGQ